MNTVTPPLITVSEVVVYCRAVLGYTKFLSKQHACMPHCCSSQEHFWSATWSEQVQNMVPIVLLLGKIGRPGKTCRLIVSNLSLLRTNVKTGLLWGGYPLFLRNMEGEPWKLEREQKSAFTINFTRSFDSNGLDLHSRLVVRLFWGARRFDQISRPPRSWTIHPGSFPLVLMKQDWWNPPPHQMLLPYCDELGTHKCSAALVYHKVVVVVVFPQAGYQVVDCEVLVSSF